MERAAYEVREILNNRILLLSRTKLYEIIAAGQLKSVRVGTKILIPRWAIEEFLRKGTR